LQNEAGTLLDRTLDPRDELLHRLAHQAAGRGFRTAYGLLGSKAEAEDAVQEALARACAHADRLRDMETAEGWFQRVLVNVCLRMLRRRRLWGWLRPRPGGEPDEAIAVIDVGGGDEPARIRALARALEKLPARQRAALILRHGEGRSVNEIAELLGVGPGTVKTHLVRGLRRLREILEVEP
jgi:RNA polymerase sigma factor (sigma-70 family)